MLKKCHICKPWFSMLGDRFPNFLSRMGISFEILSIFAKKIRLPMIRSNFLPLAFLLFLVCACAQNISKETEQERIPIFVYHAIPEKFTDVEHYQEMADAGITLSTPVLDSIDFIIKALDYSAATGTKALVSCNDFENRTEEFVAKVKDHPGLGGYFLADEPGTGSFEWLAEWVESIRKIDLDTTHLLYVNLLPIYAFSGEEEYREHLETYCDKMPLPYISFDYYPVLWDKENERVVVSPFWYQNLQMVADMAKKTGRRFSGFALATAHSLFPVPTMAHLRFQTYTNLAYGAQSLQYFTYYTPKCYDENDFHLGPITRKGKRSQVYEILREMNRELQQRAFVFMGSKMESVYHLGDSLPVGTTALRELPAHFLQLDTHGKNALVSTLSKGNEKFVVLVNGSPVDPLSVDIETDSVVKRVRRDGSLVRADLYDVEYSIEPGSCEIFTYSTLSR